MFILRLFKWTSIILHTWTVIAAFVIKGFWGGILTLFLPVIAEIYWFFQMLSHGAWLYVSFWIFHAILALIVFLTTER